ncbi:MAG: GWxTD domain-containing protein [Gemmatimonadales bacterium]|nr:GWxTD domain-containing protein [Gemmatimonadales bacterium]
MHWESAPGMERMVRTVVAPAALALGLVVTPAAAQIPAAAESAVARRDTLLTEAAIEGFLRREPSNAALRVEVGRWYRRHHYAFMRARADRYFREALTMARAQGNRRVEADAETELGRTAFIRYEQLGHRYTLLGDVTSIDPMRAINDWQYVEHFFRTYAFANTGIGAGDFRAAEDHARAALAVVTGHLVATGLLATILGDQDRWEELEAPARAAIRAFPREPDGYRILGLALQRTGRLSEAAVAFEQALARMDSVRRRPYENLGLLLRRAGAAHYDSLNAEQRAELRLMYWAVAKPLALDSVNRVLLEFYARTTYVDLRWTAPDEGVAGWETDRGLTYLRYGPPDVWATLGPLAAGSELTMDAEDLTPLAGGRVTTVWLYRQSHARFIFQNQRGYTAASYASEFSLFAREVREMAPVRFDNVPGIAAMDTILAQIAQFRGPSGGTTLAVYGFVPAGRMFAGVQLQSVPVELAAFVQDGRLRDVSRRVATQTLTLGDSSQLATQTWRFDLFPAREYLLRLEARQQATGRSARAIMGLEVRRFGPGVLALSDLVVADRVAPRDSSPRRWTDFLIDPSVGRIRRGEPVAFLWETYNLTADSSGVGRYRVELAVYSRALERRGIGARIVGGVADAVGLSARGDSLATISFERQAPVRGRTAFPEYLQVQLGDAPEGTYGVALTVTDLVSGQTATSRRQFIVTTRPEDIPKRLQD